MPLVSIITINYNNAAGLEKTILSITEQTFCDYKLIIVDGGSSDKSIQVIEKYSDKISYWVSEKDEGIYNAMNKGTTQANGAYCYYLNSGDIFFDSEVLAKVAGYMTADQMLIAGDVETVSNSGQKLLWKTKKNYRVSEIAFGHLPHQGFFFHRSLFDTYGFYNEKLKIISDWEYLLKLIINNVNIKYTELIFATHYLDGISNQPHHLKAQDIERQMVLRNLSTLTEDLNELYLTRNIYRYLIYRVKNYLNRRFN